MAKSLRKNRRATDLSEAEKAELHEIARRRIGLGAGDGADGRADGRAPSDGGDAASTEREPPQSA